jgi:hypothetical protein
MPPAAADSCRLMLSVCCAPQEERQQQRALRRVNATVEPEVLARAMLRPEDDAIRATDLPEREQLRAAPAPDEADHDACARWGAFPSSRVGVHARALCAGSAATTQNRCRGGPRRVRQVGGVLIIMHGHACHAHHAWACMRYPSCAGMMHASSSSPGFGQPNSASDLPVRSAYQASSACWGVLS